MMRRVLKLASCLLLLACFLCSCGNHAEFSGGEALSVEETQALIASWKTESSAERIEEGIYYFVTGSGAVYHSNASCAHLKNSKNVQSGTLAQAQTAGKDRLCATCAKGMGIGSELSDADGDRACYYTVGGAVWHYDPSCASLSQSENVQGGTVEQAMLAGKTRPCARCGD